MRGRADGAECLWSGQGEGCAFSSMQRACPPNFMGPNCDVCETATSHWVLSYGTNVSQGTGYFRPTFEGVWGPSAS